ncbi:protein draper [Trichonephila clavipes]|nr:protein draper [Trichonephila clavipes]
MGSRCADSCPEGFYGDHCMQVCDCSFGMVCDPKVGCVVEDINVAELNTDEATINPWFITGVSIVVFLVILIIICIATHYKKKMEQLSTDLSSVYQGERRDTLDVQHFNNPIYSSVPWMNDSTENNVSQVNNEISSHIEYDKSNLRDVIPMSKEADIDCVSEIAGIDAWILYKQTTGENISRQDFLLKLAVELGADFREAREQPKQRKNTKGSLPVYYRCLST